ncbi:MAG: hypothetical protein ACSLFQ_01475 [Thermoanaerobaculia bacterium]
MSHLPLMPVVLRLDPEHEELVQQITGFSSRQLRRKRAPIRSEGSGAGKRRFMRVDEFLAWFSNRAPLEHATQTEEDDGT